MYGQTASGFPNSIYIYIYIYIKICVYVCVSVVTFFDLSIKVRGRFVFTLPPSRLSVFSDNQCNDEPIVLTLKKERKKERKKEIQKLV